jgi:hypothetical protein
MEDAMGLRTPDREISETRLFLDRTAGAAAVESGAGLPR